MESAPIVKSPLPSDLPSAAHSMRDLIIDLEKLVLVVVGLCLENDLLALALLARGLLALALGLRLRIDSALVFILATRRSNLLALARALLSTSTLVVIFVGALTLLHGIR